MIKTINKSDWDDISNPIPIAHFDISVSEVEDLLGIEFAEYLEDGLGQCYGIFLKTKDSMVFLQGFISRKSKELGVSLSVRSFERNSVKLLEEFADIFKASTSWVKDELSEPKWVLYRLDDNDNEFEIGRFLEEHGALFVKQSYEKKKHKQTYYVKELKN